MIDFSFQPSPSDMIILISFLLIIGILFIGVRKIVISLLEIDTTVEKQITTRNMLLKEQTDEAKPADRLIKVDQQV